LDPRFGLHLAMGTRFFIALIHPDKTYDSFYRIGKSGYDYLDIELGFHYFVTRNLALGLDIRTDILLGADLYLGLIPGILYTSRIFYFRVGLQINAFPVVIFGLIPGGGLQFKINRWFSYYVGVDLPLWFYYGNDAVFAFQLALITGSRVRF